MRLFELRGTLSAATKVVLDIAGIFLLFLIWYIITAGSNPLVPAGILPSPGKVWDAFFILFDENDLVNNIMMSLGLNFAGYIEAIVLAVFFGFMIGLYPLFRGLFNRPIDALRFVPLTGVIGLFIVWFGLGTMMKVHFLAFGILIYMLPVVVRRIDDVEDVYLKTAYTLGATPWQTIKTVYFPHVLSRFSDDIRVLTAISWTYIIIIESIGNQGGLGALMWRAGIRQGSIDKLFASLLIIVVIGFVQDKFLIWLDRKLFPFKYQSDINKKLGLIKSETIWDKILPILNTSLKLFAVGIIVVLVINEFSGFLGREDILKNAFGGTYILMMIVLSCLAIYLLYDFIHVPKSKKLIKINNS